MLGVASFICRNLDWTRHRGMLDGLAFVKARRRQNDRMTAKGGHMVEAAQDVSGLHAATAASA
jgi:hypothetical protein